MKVILKASALSLVAAMALSMTGCGSSDDTTTPPPPADEIESITGKAVDGYLRYSTVCLDLSGDGYLSNRG